MQAGPTGCDLICCPNTRSSCRGGSGRPAPDSVSRSRNIGLPASTTPTLSSGTPFLSIIQSCQKGWQVPLGPRFWKNGTFLKFVIVRQQYEITLELGTPRRYNAVSSPNYGDTRALCCCLPLSTSTQAPLTECDQAQLTQNKGTKISAVRIFADLLCCMITDSNLMHRQS